MTLLESVISQTEEFKTQYLKKYEEAVRREFNRINEKYEINSCFKQVQEETGVRNIYHSRKEYLRAQDIRDILFDFQYGRIEVRIAKEMETAKRNFHGKQKMLAERLGRKGFTSDAQINVWFSNPNLEGSVTEQDFRANFYTIVAEGPIQRPHFRFLVK